MRGAARRCALNLKQARDDKQVLVTNVRSQHIRPRFNSAPLSDRVGERATPTRQGESCIASTPCCASRFVAQWGSRPRVCHSRRCILKAVWSTRIPPQRPPHINPRAMHSMTYPIGSHTRLSRPRHDSLAPPRDAPYRAALPAPRASRSPRTASAPAQKTSPASNERQPALGLGAHRTARPRRVPEVRRPWLTRVPPPTAPLPVVAGSGLQITTRPDPRCRHTAHKKGPVSTKNPHPRTQSLSSLGIHPATQSYYSSRRVPGRDNRQKQALSRTRGGGGGGGGAGVPRPRKATHEAPQQKGRRRVEARVTYTQ